MRKNTTRAVVVIGAAMALLMAGTAAVSAAPGHRDDRMPGRGMAGFGDMVPGPRGVWSDDFERREVTLQTADGITSSRVEQGTVDSSAEDALTFSLGSGESVTVTVDEDTTFIGYEEQEMTRRGWSRTVMAATEIEAADVQAGAEVLVWSDSEDGADYVASRVVVEPATDEADASDEADATDEADASDASDASDTGTEDAADETVSDAAATDA